MSELSKHFDVIVVGGGHAGCEAALAAARAGCDTLMVSPNLDRIGYMPCNPSIGGPGKSHIVAEIDALGGAMAEIADQTALQVRLLNTSKGPAVQAVRSQQDKQLYAMAMKDRIERQPNLSLLQDEVTGLLVQDGPNERPEITGATVRSMGKVMARAVVITAGTFLRGAMIAGESRVNGGRAGDRADSELAGSLGASGFELRRLKTGTPPRIDAGTVDYTLCEAQHGSEVPLWQSAAGWLGDIEPLNLPPSPLHRPSHPEPTWRPQLDCFRIVTNSNTHDLIRANLHRAPMFNGGIEGTGPRYCPSIEDKVAKFAAKEAHPVFLEPEGWRSNELYVQGMSTSLPFEIQQAALESIPALRGVRITRYGYAVEYDAVDPGELTSSLESRRIDGLFLAGQVNGTSGYEEAGGQGILAGLNAATLVAGKSRISFGRDRAYIGVMVDDLVNKPFDEPYRMLTSRAEFRLLLRPDTAEERLSGIAWENGLIDSSRHDRVRDDRKCLDQATEAFSKTWLRQDTETAEGSVSRSMNALELLRRPGLGHEDLVQYLPQARQELLATLPDRLWPRFEQEIKYQGFIEREAAEAAKRSRLEEMTLPEIDLLSVPGLRYEAMIKLERHRPRTLGEASRLSGVTPSDIGALLVHAKRNSNGG